MLASNTVVVSQPHPSNEEDWSSGLFQCTKDTKNCCFAFWCCPCHACVTTKEFGECVCLPLLDINCIPPISLSIRFAMRKRHGLKGTLCTDCLAVSFCGPCNWCQIARELKYRKAPASFGDIFH